MNFVAASFLFACPSAFLAQPERQFDWPSTFMTHTVNGIGQGLVKELGADGSAHVELFVGPQRLGPGELVGLVRWKEPLPQHAAKNVLVLVNGDRIVLDPSELPQLRED